ncbi:MAG: tRNA (adenosine(37)-N6)-dimethylallyltransferase MiaA [Patescibacteria group bacterium]|nr:tRNA (adenosine(37)-N6)-dimethylallyltransferase MiaA [Patescibacteria group bacterium]
MHKLLIICGPTATGKTSLGFNLAEEFNGEIVSADSRQVFCGMDIITGKQVDSKIKTWLIDIVNPDQRFSVADYYELAWKVISDIWHRGKLPIVVGGTGFYINALINGIETMGVEPDWKLREQLFHCSVVSLLETLEKIDPQRYRRMNESDRKNPRRLIRAIEVANQKSKIKNQNEKIKNFDSLIIGLTLSNEILYQRIDQRVEERIKMGAEDEIKKLFAQGYNWENSVLGVTIGYKEWKEYFEKKVAKEEVIQKWKFAEHDYARRQMTWFRKALRCAQSKWFDITKENCQTEVENDVKSWYS